MSDPKIVKKQSISLNLDPGKYFFCTCGESADQPFCDGAHSGTEFVPKKFTLQEPERVTLCLCKHTKRSPFCDGTHNKI